jgi:hypothetical protein
LAAFGVGHWIWAEDYDGLSRGDVAMFDLEQFIADCRAALAADRSHKSVREVVARAVSDPAAILSKDWVNQSGLRSRSSTIQTI